MIHSKHIKLACCLTLSSRRRKLKGSTCYLGPRCRVASASDSTPYKYIQLNSLHLTRCCTIGTQQTSTFYRQKVFGQLRLFIHKRYSFLCYIVFLCSGCCSRWTALEYASADPVSLINNYRPKNQLRYVVIDLYRTQVFSHTNIMVRTILDFIHSLTNYLCYASLIPTEE